MSFEKMNLLPMILGALLLLGYFFSKHEKKFYAWVKQFWNLTPKKNRIARVFLYWLGALFLGLSLLDLRGPEDRIQSQIPDQKTIIIIDSSASMLAEDVKPNRFKKATFLARHFIKNALGHQIAIVLFSDIQKRLVPFTDDIDLLDARVDGLEETNLQNGGSNISQAIKESLGYLKESSKDGVKVSGNILVLTDSEDHSSFDDLEIPDSVALAVVGIGTAKGAKIPIRTSNGVFRGYKRYNGEEVITKLDEEWMKRLQGKVKNYKYWISNSFSLPTQEIVNFFRSTFLTKFNQGAVRVRPVLSHYLVLTGLFFFSVSFLFYLPNQWIWSFVLILSFTVSTSQQIKAEEQNEEPPPLSLETQKLLSKHQEGILDAKDSIALASRLLKEKRIKQAVTLFQENRNLMNQEEMNNFAVALAKLGETQKALEVLKEAQTISSKPEDQEVLYQNTLKVLKEQKKQQKQQQNKDKQKKNRDKQKEKSGKDKSQKKNSKENQKNDQKDEAKNKGSDSKENDQQKKESEGKDGKSKDQKKKENSKSKEDKGEGEESKQTPKEKQAPQSLKDKEEQIRLKRKMQKVPGFVKQILDDDRNLQKRYLDTRGKSRKQSSKDW